MLFNSYEFIFLFLPVVLFGFFWVARISHRLAALWLAAASIFFYGWWNPRFVLLLLVSVAFNFLAGRMLGRARGTARAKLLLVASLTCNLLLIGIFKYTNFFITTLNGLAFAQLPVADIVLPIGISFFTFTQIAFLVDVYRGFAKEYNFVHYLLFVTYFPHLIAGPILHHKQIMPQFAENATYRVSADNLAVGVTIFAIGLAKKVLLADSFGDYVGPVFDSARDGTPLGFFIAWIGALAYTFQLYFDFSGYSDMAIGLSRLFGVEIPLNFNSPYKATSIIDFWRRWHMTLSQFLRDYLYFSLGGNKRGTARRYLNLMVTMLLGGLWHGANWTFVVWGGLHGIYLIINHAWRAILERAAIPALVSPRIGTLFSGSLTFLAVVVAWVFFRSENFPTTLVMLKGMAGMNGVSIPSGLQTWLPALTNIRLDGFLEANSQLLGLGTPRFAAILLAGSAIVWLMPNTQEIFRRGSAFISWTPTRTWAVSTAILMSASLLMMGKVSEFLYFQF
jgi:alginate O-acetyltransferase complex protein AlgI